MNGKGWKRAAAVIGIIVLASACTDASTGKGGGPAAKVELVLASNDGGQTLDGAPAVQHFVDRLTELSGGRMTVRLEASWKGGGNEPQVIRSVAAGEADLGWSGTRAFDLVGVESLTPLHAPFLVNSYPLQAAVVKQGSARLLADVPTAGVTPLALTADELRFPAATAKPLLDLADWQGLGVRTTSSRLQAAAITSLAAKPVLDGDVNLLLQGRSIQAIETMWWTYKVNGYSAGLPYITANVALWPRTVVIFANPAALARLSDQQRDWVVSAGTEASAWSVDHPADRIQQYVADACKAGAKVAMASATQLAALRARAEPVYAELRKYPARAEILQWISTLRSSLPQPAVLAVPQGCAYQVGDENKPRPEATKLTAPGPTGTMPLGTYRYTLTVDDLVAAGTGQAFAIENAGVWTWKLGKGVFEVSVNTSEQQVPMYPCSGYFAVQGDTATFTRVVNQPKGDCIPPTWAARWTAANNSLTWSAVDVMDFGPDIATKPWQKIS